MLLSVHLINHIYMLMQGIITGNLMVKKVFLMILYLIWEIKLNLNH